MRADIDFCTLDGTRLSASLYRPETTEGPFPAIVLSHGYGAVKEMALDQYAESFCKAGFALSAIRSPQHRCKRRHAQGGNRPLATNLRHEGCDYLSLLLGMRSIMSALDFGEPVFQAVTA